MLTPPNGRRKGVVEQIARRAMKERGFLTDFSRSALNELEKMQQVDWGAESPVKDLRQLLWASIDNDDSLDLDQLTVAETLSDKTVKILVAIADVDVLVKKNSAIDEHARQNTTSVYTAGKTFPMLPEKLSTDLTSLNYDEDRPAMIIEVGGNKTVPPQLAQRASGTQVRLWPGITALFVKNVLEIGTYKDYHRSISLDRLPVLGFRKGWVCRKLLHPFPPTKNGPLPKAHSIR
jgi:hypothetical protein